MEEGLLFRKKLNFNQGSNFFRQRLALSLLSARPIKITEIRSQSDFSVGVSDYEVSFIRLLDKLSNGSRFKISETGTEVDLIPGALLGGTVTHVCHDSRPFSYYLEPILLLAPFCKKPLRLTLKGKIQNDITGYNSIYKLKHAALPIMEIFGLETDLQVKSRSYEESEIIFTSTVKKQLLTLRNQLSQDCGKVKKVRGLAYGFRVPPQLLNRVITEAKGVLIPFINDVFITNDPVKSKSQNPGYGIILYAETTKNIVYAADGFTGRDEIKKAEEHEYLVKSNLSLSGSGRKRGFELFPDEEKAENKNSKKQKISNDEGGSSAETAIEDKSQNLNVQKAVGFSKTPEELGVAIAKQLLKEIGKQSRVDSVFQWLVLGFMSLSPKDVTSVVLGPLTPFTVQFLRDLKTFFGVTFKVEDYKEKSKLGDEDEDDDDDNDERQRQKKFYKLSCLGTGYINLNKTMV